MSENKFQNLHFSMLEDFLPVGMAIFERAKDGGADKVLQGLFSSDHPIEKLRDEGLSAAKSLREKLDKISPGLGNPAFEVRVNPNNLGVDNDQLDNELLVDILQRIEDRLSVLESSLDDGMFVDS